MATRLISVDSHVKVDPADMKARMPSKFHHAWDDAMAADRSRQVERLYGMGVGVGVG